MFELRPSSLGADELLENEEEWRQEAARLTQWRDELLDVVNDDDEAQLMVLGMMEGRKGEDLRVAVGIPAERYPTLYRKVMRRIGSLQRKQS